MLRRWPAPAARLEVQGREIPVPILDVPRKAGRRGGRSGWTPERPLLLGPSNVTPDLRLP